MNATDTRVLGASALTAAVVSMVTVTVYTGHVKVSERGQTVIVQPGETHTVVPAQPAPPSPEPVVAGTPMFDRARNTIADVRIPAGESSTINAPTLPVMVEVDAAGRCSSGVEYFRDGVQVSGALLMLDDGMHGYAVRCAGSTTNIAVGQLVVVAGGCHIPFPTPSAADPNRAPDPSGQVVFLAQPGQGAVWSDPLPVQGQVVANATVSIGNLDVPVSADGRFAASIPLPTGLTLAVRVDHAQRGTHYVVVRSKPAKTTTTTTVTASDTCDEVSCVLSDDNPACCAKYKKGPTPPAGDTLDRVAISEGIAKVKPRIRACGDGLVTEGKVMMAVTVRADGSVGSAIATQTFSQPVATCVTDVLRAARFRATKQGGAFNYPFLFTPDVSTIAAAGGSGLSRDDISKTIAAAKSRIAGCNPGSTASGKVIVNVKVRPDGKVGAISTKESYDSKVSGCVIDIVKTLVFPATQDGGTFSYPFVFDAPACDTDALRDQGMEAINKGQHAAALATFEASLRCKQDAYVEQLAFMSACNAHDQAKARQHYQLLSPAQQTKFVVLCTRNGIDVTSPATASDVGFLQVLSKPAGGKVLVDGVDTKKVTPVMGKPLELAPGRHKITIVIGADRFTWPVVIEAGAVVTLDKVLE
jgi:hypothetical protein